MKPVQPVSKVKTILHQEQYESGSQTEQLQESERGTKQPIGMQHTDDQSENVTIQIIVVQVWC